MAPPAEGDPSHQDISTGAGRKYVIVGCGVSLLSRFAYRSGRSPDWLKMKNPACAAVKRETVVGEPPLRSTPISG